MDKLEKCIVANPEQISKADSMTFAALLKCFQAAGYKSQRWHDVIWPQIKTALFHCKNGKYDDQLISITETLIGLGYASDVLIERVLSKEFVKSMPSHLMPSLKQMYWYTLYVKKCDGIEFDLTGLKQLRLDLDAENYKPLQKEIADEIETSKYLNFVTMEHGAVENVVKVNKTARELVQIRLKDESPATDGKFTPIDNIVLEPNEQL